MKTIFETIPWKHKLVPLLLLLLMFKPEAGRSQAIDCLSGTTMYGVFVDTLGSGHDDSTEIRPINFNTGVIGPLMGGRRYYILRGSRFGAAAMAVSGVTNRFYLMTQMSSSTTKDIIAVNPLAATHATAVTVVGSTPASMSNYHFVKLATAPLGAPTPGPTQYAYAIGVVRDSSLATANTYNPLIRFNTCITAGCATVTVLGYLPPIAGAYKTQLFNGDIAFDANGNLYFATAAFEVVGTIPRYTDSRLFRINSTDIPTSAGTGLIPMTFVADFNSLDSTVVNGISFDAGGNMYFATRRFTGVQTSPAGHSESQLYAAYFAGSASQIPGFDTDLTMPDKSVSDLASCYYPFGVLSANALNLTGQYDIGKATLRWKVNNNNLVNLYEVQSSTDGVNFSTEATIYPENADQPNAVYEYRDSEEQLGKMKYYRVRESMKSGMRFYSNILQIFFNNKINLTGSITPNPVIDHFNFTIQLRAPKSVSVKLADQSGRIVFNAHYNGKAGENKFLVNALGNLKKGIYFVEISADNDVIREKLMKQ